MFTRVSREVDDSKVRMERARLKITQKELARRAKTTREKICAIENVTCKTVSFEILERLAEVFGIEVQELFKKEER